MTTIDVRLTAARGVKDRTTKKFGRSYNVTMQVQPESKA